MIEKQEPTPGRLIVWDTTLTSGGFFLIPCHCDGIDSNVYQRKGLPRCRFCEKVIAAANSLTQRKSAGGPSASTIEIWNLWCSQRGLCAYCSCCLIEFKSELDHITPVRELGVHSIENLQFLCVPCHVRKTAEEWLRARLRKLTAA